MLMKVRAGDKVKKVVIESIRFCRKVKKPKDQEVTGQVLSPEVGERGDEERGGKA